MYRKERLEIIHRFLTIVCLTGLYGLVAGSILYLLISAILCIK
jgi:hypothetical protein